MHTCSEPGCVEMERCLRAARAASQRKESEMQILRTQLGDVRRYCSNVARSALESDTAADYKRAFEIMLTSGLLVQTEEGEG